MPKRSSKLDVNQLAADILAHAVGDKPEDAKNPAAVALGRLGGLKGGKGKGQSAISL